MLKRAPPRAGALHGDAAALALDDGPRDREPEAEARSVALPRRACPDGSGRRAEASRPRATPGPSSLTTDQGLRAVDRDAHPTSPPAGENFTALSRMLVRARPTAVGPTLTVGAAPDGLDDDADRAAAGLRGQTPHGVVHDRQQRDGGRLPPGRSLRIQVGQGQQLLGELREALHLLEARAKRLLVLGGVPGAAQGDLDLGAQPRKRRAQLVRGIRGEPPLGLDAPLHAIEHGVEGVDEAPELVLARGLGQALGQVRLADAASLGHDLVDRPQGPPREDDRRHGDAGEEQQREPEEEPTAGGEDAVGIVEGARHEDRVAAAPRADRERGHADRLLAEVLEGLEDDLARLQSLEHGLGARAGARCRDSRSSPARSRPGRRSGRSGRGGRRKAGRSRERTRGPGGDGRGAASRADASVSASATSAASS